MSYSASTNQTTNYKFVPVGVVPHEIWLSLRRKDILDAITRYTSAGLDYPKEWDDELHWILTQENQF